MRKIVAGMAGMALVVVAVGAARGDVPAVTHYLGTMDGKIAISMAIDEPQQALFYGERDPIHGSYLYALYGKDLTFTGKRTFAEAPKTDYTLKESTGVFELASEKSGKLTGVWKSADGKKQLPVALMPVAKSVTVISAKSDAYEVRTAYLQFTAKTAFLGALNERLEKEGIQGHNTSLVSMAQDAERDKGERSVPYACETSATVLFVSDTLVSTRGFRYAYTGGAHGNWGYGAVNFGWVNGKVVEIAPEMIVAKEKWPALRDLCVKHLKEQGASEATAVKFDKDRVPTIMFTGQGLLLTFDPYETGAYAEGARVVSLPWAEVKGLVASGSAVAGLLPK